MYLQLTISKCYILFYIHLLYDIKKHTKMFGFDYCNSGDFGTLDPAVFGAAIPITVVVCI